ncbi:MAG: long-chain fatty acid--CoA ligase [Bacteroidetes bacterium]|nr:long-chain fatty acid--CoA ligase [Bacteroidota bacterium]MBU1372915.1 long-chain fatty acid--CoA ligase [Bacteroidota bacterium]MBU1484179.1 long-chain fatty acid--CoA ligase [Bacteroidota bacterium]MBU1761757.1 long-chain fatty acid--CoA ligase [Bacteroidota bacterium]MBU2267402.1 long-chain fatty acid--CoA ligase [Bacteroidota bacterium]
MKTISRVFDLLPYNKEKYNSDDALATKVDGKWKKYSISDFINTVDELSRGLIKAGIKRNDKVAVMSPNRPEWNFSDFAIMQIGATQVPMYPTLAENDIKFILNDAEVKIVFVSDEAIYRKIEKVKKEGGLDIAIYTFDKIDKLPNWTAILELGKQNLDINLEEYRSQISPDDLLTLIYTSGTTGTPKGVMLTHENLISNVMYSSRLYPDNVKRALSFLPLSHIFERMVCYMYIYLGISIYYAESIDTVVTNLAEVKPHCFTTVPRLLEKIYDRIVAKGHQQTGIKKQLFFWALNLGLKYEMDGKNGFLYELQLKIARKLVFSKWKEALGGEVLTIVSGGAALQERLARVFWGAGIKVLEGYGLTETSPVIAVNGPFQGQCKFGTVGEVLENLEVKIAADGEILCKGPSVMKGYYKRPDATEEAIKDGWFHTGDIGELKGGFLAITDRKKEVFKTAGGKYVAPQVLENKFKESIYIEQIMVIGENRRFPSALIVPNFEKLREWASRNDIQETEPEKLIKMKQVCDKIWSEVNRLNEGFGNWEKVKKIALSAHEFTIDGEELTPKLSLKRKVILQKYANLIDQLYIESNSQENHV